MLKYELIFNLMTITTYRIMRTRGFLLRSKSHVALLAVSDRKRLNDLWWFKSNGRLLADSGYAFNVMVLWYGNYPKVIFLNEILLIFAFMCTIAKPKIYWYWWTWVLGISGFVGKSYTRNCIHLKHKTQHRVLIILHNALKCLRIRRFT